MMNEAIYGGERHRLIWKNPAPFAEWLICGDQQGTSLVASTDQFEKHAQISLTPERRSSPSSKSMQAASILSLVVMLPLPETR